MHSYADSTVPRYADGSAKRLRTVAPGVYQRGSKFVAVWRRADGTQGWQSFAEMGRAVAFRDKMIELRHANPLTPLRALCEDEIERQERQIGEALPHLYLARTHLRTIEQAATREGEFLWKGLD